jgi:HlyD family secretion protein
MKKTILFGFLGILVIGVIFFLVKGGNGNNQELKYIEVKRSSITDQAMAVGTIEPENEIRVKSAISGIVNEIYFKVGDFIQKGKPLFRVSPNPTPLEYAESRRNMEVAQVVMNQVKREMNRKLKLLQSNFISRSDFDMAESAYDEANLKYKIARERFELLEKGCIKLSEKDINSTVISPITGIVLSQNVYVGDPVVPLTNFQPGTELCAMADLKKMLFKGTVDEIDVGKLSPGMKTNIEIGALPDTKVEGRLDRISPKARKDGNATLFDVEISIVKVTGKALRAGYSANAKVKIKERTDVLVIPERLVTIEKDKRYVEIKKGEEIVKAEIKTGLSDGLNIEVISGLKEGQLVVERPPREIE